MADFNSLIQSYDLQNGKYLDLKQSNGKTELLLKESFWLKVPFFGRLYHKWVVSPKFERVIKWLLENKADDLKKSGDASKKIKISIEHFFEKGKHKRVWDHVQDKFYQIWPKDEMKAEAQVKAKEQAEISENAEAQLRAKAEAEERARAEERAKAEAEERARAEAGESAKVESVQREMDAWTEQFIEKHCRFDNSILSKTGGQLTISVGMKKELEKIINEHPNIRFYFNMPIGARMDPDVNELRELAKTINGDGFIVLVPWSFAWQNKYAGDFPLKEIENQPLFAWYNFSRPLDGSFALTLDEEDKAPGQCAPRKENFNKLVAALKKNLSAYKDATKALAT